MKRLAITTGDPAGIGPEIAAKALCFHDLQPGIAYVVYGELDPWRGGHAFTPIERIEQATEPGRIYLIPIGRENVAVGQATPVSGAVSLDILRRVLADLTAGHLHGVATCPVSKHAIRCHDRGFIGHTEFFAGDDHEVVMTFWGEHFNLALLTTHMAVSEVGRSLTEEMVTARLRVLWREVSRYVQGPHMALLAVNPHGGEQGAFGEEDHLLGRVLGTLSAEGIDIAGPFPADSFFRYHAADYDFVISAYHDQGLIPFKMVHGEEGVNVTLGLPWVRTSVDHGPAYDIAGQGRANEKSLVAALVRAEQMLDPGCAAPRRIYSAFAEHYDRYMEHVDYDAWVALVLGRFNRLHRRSPRRVIELACGTGNIATRLVRKGIEVEASDFAPAMLLEASQKNFAPLLHRADMLAPLPPERYDLVLLLFDSLNYLRTDQDVATLLEQTYGGLEPGGVFIFDISTLHNCREYFDGFMNIDEGPGFYMVHTSEHEPAQDRQTNHFTIFTRRGFLFERRDEYHTQHIFRVQQVLDSIEDSPFKLCGVYALDKDNNLADTDPERLDESFTRLFFVLQKEN
ncbi:MAG: 4-hydroxythreonine-4-phosphate dehydrogenase PdxA [Candidatus Cloacimonetes bacterium]|nr:4-hydroxythreonine-4-phosphate dehydrogenase PdxA [Candidatus Cloacimonadota bacterium]